MCNTKLVCIWRMWKMTGVIKKQSLLYLRFSEESEIRIHVSWGNGRSIYTNSFTPAGLLRRKKTEKSQTQCRNIYAWYIISANITSTPTYTQYFVLVEMQDQRKRIQWAVTWAVIIINLHIFWMNFIIYFWDLWHRFLYKLHIATVKYYVFWKWSPKTFITISAEVRLLRWNQPCPHHFWKFYTNSRLQLLITWLVPVKVSGLASSFSFSSLIFLISIISQPTLLFFP